MDIHLSVVIPAYNEESRLKTSLERIVEYLSSQDYRSEILLVDDGSTDRTVEVAQEVAPEIRIIRNDRNRGKGYSVRHGMMQAKGAYRLFSDADLSTPIEEIEKFWPEFEKGYDVVIASRALPDSQVEVHQSWVREQCGRTFNKLVKIIAMSKFKDTQCGFKAFSASAAGIIFPRQTISGWGFDTELLYIAQKHRLKVNDVPVRWLNSANSRLNLIKDSSHMFFELLSVRWKALTGKYE